MKAKVAFHELDVGSYGGAFLSRFGVASLVHPEAAQGTRQPESHLQFRTPRRLPRASVWPTSR